MSDLSHKVNWGGLRPPLLHAALLVALVLVCYSGTFTAPLIGPGAWDDPEREIFARLSPELRDETIFESEPGKGQDAASAITGQPVLRLIHALTDKALGQSLGARHALSITLHIASVLLLYALLKAMLKGLVSTAIRCDMEAAALFGAGLFAVHPALTGAVNEIAMYSALLSALFVLGTLYLYVKARGEDGGLRYGFYLAALLSAFAAINTRDGALGLPLVMAVYEIYFLKGEGKKRFLYLAPFIIIALAVKEPFEIIDGHRLSLLTLGLRLALMPVNLGLIYKIEPLGELSPLILALHGLLVYLALRPLLWRSLASTRGGAVWRAAGFGVFLFYISLWQMVPGPMSSDYIMISPRLYLSLGGLALGAGALAGFYFPLIEEVRVRRLLGYGLIGLVSLLAVATAHRNLAWRSEVSLWQEALERAPHSARAWSNLGRAQLKEGKEGGAMISFREALMAAPEDPVANNNMGDMYLRQGLPDQAINYYERAVKLKPDYAEAYASLGLAYQQVGMVPVGIKMFRKSIEARPDYLKAHINMGLAYASLGMRDQAVKALEEAVRLRPDSARGHYNLGLAYFDRGEVDRAIEQYNRALEAKPDYTVAYYSLTGLLLLQGRAQEAVAALSKALAYLPEEPMLYDQLSQAYAKLGKGGLAGQYAQRAAELRGARSR